MGAWIEICEQLFKFVPISVAPPVGAWIEIYPDVMLNCEFPMVAPPVGAWIEIYDKLCTKIIVMSLPPWERGLKSCTINKRSPQDTSLPPWERGLKF